MFVKLSDPDLMIRRKSLRKEKKMSPEAKSEVEVLKKINVMFDAKLGPSDMRDVLTVEEEDRFKPKLEDRLAMITAYQKEAEELKEKKGKVLQDFIKKNQDAGIAKLLAKAKALGFSPKPDEVRWESHVGSLPVEKVKDPGKNYIFLTLTVHASSKGRESEWNSETGCSITFKRRINIPTAVTKLEKQMEDIKAKIAATEAEAVEIKKELSKVPEVVKRHMAHLVKRMMLQSSEGQTMFDMATAKPVLALPAKA